MNEFLYTLDSNLPHTKNRDCGGRFCCGVGNSCTPTSLFYVRPISLRKEYRQLLITDGTPFSLAHTYKVEGGRRFP